MKMKKLLIVDGNSIMNRAFYGVRPLVTRSGIQTNAVYGYLTILKKHLDAIKPDYAAVAFDLKAPTFRHKMYGEYKAGRHKTPDELLSQVPYIKEATALLGIKTLCVEGFEADDILGTLSANFDDESYIVTGDRDSLQLVSDKTTVILASTGEDIVYTPSEIAQKYSLPPKKLIDVKALAGDSSDNIPGVAGIGEKTAIKLILDADSLEGIYEALDNGTLKATESVKSKLINGRASAELSRRLAEICLSVAPLPPYEELTVDTQDTLALRELFVKLEFTKLMSRFGLDKAEPAPIAEDSGNQISIDLFDTPTSDIKGVSSSELLSLMPDGTVPLDVLDKRAYIEKDGTVYSCDIDAEFLEGIRGKRLCLFDSKEFWLSTGDFYDVLDESTVAFDIQLASYVDNPDSRGELARIAMAYLSRGISPMAESMPEVRVPLIGELYRELSSRIDAQGLGFLYYEVELPLSRVLAGMEMRGFAVDKEGIADYGNVLKSQMDSVQESIMQIAGESFNVNSPKQLGVILYEKLGLPVIKKNKRGYSTDAETLEKLRFHSPIIDFILDYRRLAKLYGTYIEGLLKVVHDDGRIRTSFNQKITQTGRLSSTEPNLQNIPIRTEQGSKLRKFFTAGEGKVLIDADYSQIELRVLAHISGDENLINAFNSGADIHSATASLVFGVPLDKVTHELRGRAKAVNFGIVYGIGEFSLAGDLHVSMKEAKDYIVGYFNTYPKVKEYLDTTVRKATESGYVTTLWGRKRYIPELGGTNKQLKAFGERVAKNSPIQGTAADLIKLAMVKTDRRLKKEGLESRLILQVHDELIIESPTAEAEAAAQILKEEMESVADMAVKPITDIGIGKSWLEAKQ